MTVNIGYDNGKRATTFVHRLVLESFAGLRPYGMVACHIDGDKTNNHANNLRWDSQRENVKDRERHKKEK